MGGFARVYDVLKRGKELDDRLFFEFRWGFFFWIHRNDSFGLWPDKRLLRGFQRCVQLVSEIDFQEYSADGSAPKLATANVNEICFLSQQVIEPAYQSAWRRGGCVRVRAVMLLTRKLPRAQCCPFTCATSPSHVRASRALLAASCVR